jgi:hypothetical protein
MGERREGDKGEKGMKERKDGGGGTVCNLRNMKKGKGRRNMVG